MTTKSNKASKPSSKSSPIGPAHAAAINRVAKDPKAAAGFPPCYPSGEGLAADHPGCDGKKPKAKD